MAIQQPKNVSKEDRKLSVLANYFELGFLLVARILINDSP